MSKCQISITFDRPDRVYFGGENVGGKVRVAIEEEIKGKGIRLIYRWRTHGRGNSDSGPEEVISLAGPQLLMAGEMLEFSFTFTAPTHPVTYRGHLISIDHYVRVEVDVPWARNPSASEEFLLRPGKIPSEMTGQRDKIVSLQPPATAPGWLGTAVLWTLGLLLLTAIGVFFVFLLPVILIVAAWYWIRKAAVAARVGNVETQVPHLIVAPDEEWSVAVRFTPRKSFTINSIAVTILGQESATSGSGSDRKTTTHEIVSQRHVLREGGVLMAGETVDERLTIRFPSGKAFSFGFSDNSVKWSAEIRIDIPKFPDWSKTEILQVVPIEFLGDQAQLPDGTTGSERTVFAAEESTWYDSSRADDDSDDFDNESESENDERTESGGQTMLSGPVLPGPMKTEAWDAVTSRPETSEMMSGERTEPPATIEELVAQLALVDRNHNLRAQVISNAAGQPLEVAVVIDRVVASIGISESDREYAGGKTITGTIAGTRQLIEIITPEPLNSELEGFRRGDMWETTVHVESWDSLYNRIRVRQAD